MPDKHPNLNLPNFPPVDRGQRVGSQGDFFEVSGESNKGVRTYVLTPDLVICLNRLNGVYQQNNQTEGSINNVMVPVDFLPFKRKTEFYSQEQTCADLVFVKMDGDMSHFYSKGEHLSPSSRFSLVDLVTFVYDSCTALSFLEKIKIAHGDIKDANFLYRIENSGEVHFYLTDYGNMVPGSLDDSKPDDNARYKSSSFHDRTHLGLIIRTFITGQSSEYIGWESDITNIFGDEMVYLLNTLTNPDPNDFNVNYLQFFENFKAIIKGKFSS